MAYLGMGALNCSILPFGGQGLVDPACWCLAVGQTICDWVNGKGTYKAALGMNAPDVAFPSPPAPPPAAGPSTIQQETVPGAWTPDMAIAAQSVAQKQQASAFFKNIADALNAQNSPDSTPGFSTWALVAIAIAAGVIVFAVPGRRRR